jgi:hypothetical protein
MRYSISHLGVPIGDVELTPAETAVGELTCASGYEGIREVVRSASEALAANGFWGQPGRSVGVDPAAFRRAQNLSLELRDELGAFVPVDFINIVEGPATDAHPVVFVRFRFAHGHVASRPRAGDMPGGDSGRRDA